MENAGVEEEDEDEEEDSPWDEEGEEEEEQQQMHKFRGVNEQQTVVEEEQKIGTEEEKEIASPTRRGLERRVDTGKTRVQQREEMLEKERIRRGKAREESRKKKIDSNVSYVLSVYSFVFAFQLVFRGIQHV